MNRPTPNGCGPDGALLNKDKFYKKACETHDLEYDFAVMSRKDADKQFLKQMTKKANGNFFRLIQAYLYYFMVRLFGGLFYDKWINENK